MPNYPLFYLRFLKPPPTECHIGQHFTIVWTIESDLGDQTYWESVPVNITLQKSTVSSSHVQHLGLREVTSNESAKTNNRKKASPYPVSTPTTASKSDIIVNFDPFRGGGMVTRLVIEELMPGRGSLPLNTEVAVQLSLTLSTSETEKGHKVWQHAYPFQSSIWVIPAWSVPFTATTVKQRHGTAGRSADQAERVLQVCCNNQSKLIRIKEDAVQSIARHVWDCGLGMCAFLSEYKLDRDNATILELGSGTGLVGIFASLQFKTEKTYLTDLPDALEIIQQNVNLIEEKDRGDKEIIVAELSWGSQRLSKYKDVNVVLLTDVLYNQSSHDVLLDTLSWLLENDNCMALLAYKERNPDEREFFEKVAARSWKSTQLTNMDDFMCEIYLLQK